MSHGADRKVVAVAGMSHGSTSMAHGAWQTVILVISKAARQLFYVWLYYLVPVQGRA